MKIKKLKVEILFRDAITLDKTMNLRILASDIQDALSCDSYGINRQRILLANIKSVKILE